MKRNIKLLCESLDKKFHLIRGKCHISTSSGEKEHYEKVGKLREKNNALRPWTKFHVDCYFSSFCDMCQKFPSFVRWKRQCKQNVQIEIPDKTLEKTSTFCWRPLRLWYLFQFITSSSKTHSGPHLAFFWRFSNFFLQTDRFRVDFFFVTLNLTTFSIIFLLFLLPQIYQLSISSFFLLFSS